MSQSTHLYQYSEAVSPKVRAAYATSLEGWAALSIRSGPKQVKQYCGFYSGIILIPSEMLSLMRSLV